MDPKCFYGSKKAAPLIMRVPPQDKSDDSCLSDSDDSDNEYVPTEDASTTDDSYSSGSDAECEAATSNQDLGATSRKATENVVGKRPIVWKAVNAAHGPKAVPAWGNSLPDADVVKTPMDYFSMFIDDTLLDYIAEQSNLFSVQSNVSKPLHLTKSELEQFLGTILYVSIYQLPCTRMYWQAASRLGHVADIMSRDRWCDIKRNLHFNENHNMPRPDDSNKDRLFKIRPIIESLLPKFKSIPHTQMLCVDEEMVPFKGQSALKQYLPNKPNKWGYKIFILCDTNGLVHNFEIYTGKINPVVGCPDVGASGNIVLLLAQIVESNQNNLVFFDNWFSSLNLMAALMKRGIPMEDVELQWQQNVRSLGLEGVLTNIFLICDNSLSTPRKLTLTSLATL